MTTQNACNSENLEKILRRRTGNALRVIADIGTIVLVSGYLYGVKTS